MGCALLSLFTCPHWFFFANFSVSSNDFYFGFELLYVECRTLDIPFRECVQEKLLFVL